MNLIGRMEGIQRLGKNKWYERSHWTYKVNRRWLIKRGIEAFHWSNSQGFHWSIFPRAKFLWEIPKNFRVDPEVFPKKKEAAKTREKKKAQNIISLTLSSLPIESFPVSVTSFSVTSGDVTAPPQMRPGWCIYTTCAPAVA